MFKFKLISNTSYSTHFHLYTQLYEVTLSDENRDVATGCYGPLTSSSAFLSPPWPHVTPDEVIMSGSGAAPRLDAEESDDNVDAASLFAFIHSFFEQLVISIKNNWDAGDFVRLTMHNDALEVAHDCNDVFASIYVPILYRVRSNSPSMKFQRNFLLMLC